MVARLFLALAFVLASAAALAQTPPAQPLAQDSPDLQARQNQKVEKIRIEGESVVIDEIRYGGQTQSITVQPKKGELPAYEIRPQDATRQGASSQRDGVPGNGQSFWNVLRF